MSLFEKIFNYQILSRLEESGTFMITSQERDWLTLMLQHPAATMAFSAETLETLNMLFPKPSLAEALDENLLIEKARSREVQVFHPLLPSLRGHIMHQHGLQIAYEIRNGRMQSAQGFPYKLEYSMVKREWYLLWYHRSNRTLMNTRLSKIISFDLEPIVKDEADRMLAEISRLLESSQTEVTIEVVPRYNQELSRILYAFSCFEKEVSYEAEQDQYHIRIRLPMNEYEYLLSKIRFLGQRVRVIEGDYLQRRMREASRKALARYGED
ncbi:putative DNA-binding transcriptional regulator YafY [Paenibacillus shirakamiensis]|uniref:DNA-binding transcriptional regulator YafY n=1 Tax=Paenibacillus shirakamiensis TaxID=1265935 RepID=A0ABS4JGI0_9BACL|nr:WYL domain-containing protein [Paenibacillus shirakamiensis]MBP2000818.1 putative DNA-binding transcriptional regulator YafY [Paenibacillus shirakamiensis]